MRVMVTGHNGYVGKVMTPMLVQAGHEVVGLDTNLYQGSSFGDEPVVTGLTEVQKDIRDVDFHDLAGIDAVIHLAALSNDPLGDLNPALTYEINHRRRCAWRNWPNGPALSVLSFLRRAATMAPAAMTGCAKNPPSIQ